MSLISRIIETLVVPLGDAVRGIPLRARYRELLQSQWWDPGELARLRRHKLRKLIGHAYRRTRYYREALDAAGVAPARIQGPEDLALLPVLTKAIIRERREDLVATGVTAADRLPQYTGGTTGEPLHFYFDRNTWATGRAVLYRAFSWGGYSLGDPMANLVGGSLGGGTGRRLQLALLRKLQLPAFRLREENLDEYIGAIRQSGAVFLRGYASVLALLADLLRRRGQTLPLQAVFPTAEVLHPHQRQLMQEVFGSLVLDFYGCGEIHGVASECDRGTLHVADEHVVMEVTENGRPAPPQTAGEVLLTDLDNFTMPLIRYQVGDMAERGTVPCRCGRALTPLARLHGRVGDMLLDTSGRRISGLFFPHLIGPLEGIQEYQVIQDRLDHLDFAIVRTAELSEETVQQILKTTREYMGADMQIEVRYVDRIDRPASRKSRFTVCRVDDDQIRF